MSKDDPESYPDSVVVRKSGRGWQVGSEHAADLTSAMVLADLIAADLGTPAAGAPGVPGTPGVPAAPPRARSSEPVSEEDEAARLAVTVAQLEHALTARVRVEQAIGVLAERHRLRPRQAFELLRDVARSAGRRVNELAQVVVDSVTNPLLPLPTELARTPAPPKPRGSRRRVLPAYRLIGAVPGRCASGPRLGRARRRGWPAPGRPSPARRAGWGGTGPRAMSGSGLRRP